MDYEVKNIRQWLSGKSIFITGGSGYLGKVLLDRLLRTIPELDKIYITMRGKRGKSVDERLNDLKVKSRAFDNIRADHPHLFDKIIALNGDISLPKLGLSDHDRQIIIDNVSVVFHGAATVRFDEPLKKALTLNFLGTLEIINLCKEMKKLDIFVHVSTAYTNCDRKVIPEEVLPAKMNWRKLVTAAHKYDDSQWNILTPHILSPYPNTYIFTKNMAEAMVYDHRKELPIVIYRPSIVLNALEHPCPGFIDHLASPIAVLTGVGVGVLRCWCTDADIEINYVPVDTTCNGMIAAAWYRAEYAPKKKVESELVYNSNTFLAKYAVFDDFCKADLERNPIGKGFWYPTCLITKHWIIYKIYFLLLHVIPGLFVDTLLGLMGKQKRLLKVYRTVYGVSRSLIYFTTTEWFVKTDHFKSLKYKMKPEDERIYPIDEPQNVRKYFADGYDSVLDVILNLPREPRKQARIYHTVLYWIHTITKYSLGLYFLYKIPYEYLWVSVIQGLESFVY